MGVLELLDEARLLDELKTTELELLELTGTLLLEELDTGTLLEELDTGTLLTLDEELLGTLELTWLEWHLATGPNR